MSFQESSIKNKKPVILEDCDLTRIDSGQAPSRCPSGEVLLGASNDKLMKISVGSTNPIKINAVKLAFAAVWPEETFEVTGIDVDSGVSSQPMSDIESIKGATNRAKNALEKSPADFGVGLEGGIQQLGENWFDKGWIVVINNQGQVGIGSSINMLTPPKMIKMIQEEKLELGEVNDILFNKTNSKQAEGHFGLMTNNLITRADGYKDAVISALVRFIHPELYE